MLDCLKVNNAQFFSGMYLGNSKELDYPKNLYFKYEQLTEQQKRYYHLVANLITSEDDLIIRTNWNLDFKVQDKVKLNDGQIYTIKNIQVLTLSINPQANALVKDANKMYYLEIT